MPHRATDKLFTHSKMVILSLRPILKVSTRIQSLQDKEKECACYTKIFHTFPDEITAFQASSGNFAKFCLFCIRTMKATTSLGHVLAIIALLCSILGMETFTVVYQPIKFSGQCFKLTKRHILFASSQMALVG